MAEAPTPITIEAERCTYTLDASHAPRYVLVSGFGAFDAESFADVRAALVGLMDRVVGPGRAFCPVIFDMSCGRPAAKVTMPDLRRADSPLMRRYDRVILIYQGEEGTFFDFYVSLFEALAPRAERAASLDAALALLET